MSQNRQPSEFKSHNAPLALRMARSWASSSKTHLAALIFLGIAAYHNNFNVPFVFDDLHAIVGNPAIEDISKFLEQSLLTRSRALVDLTFALQWHFHQNNVLPFHLLNLLIHCLNGILAYVITSKLLALKPNPKGSDTEEALAASWPAFVASAFFLLHPVQTQAVTYIVQRYTALMATFYLAAVWAFLKFRQDGRLFYGILMCFCAYGAFLCKQNALTLPLSLLAMEGLFFSEHRRFWTHRGPWMLAPILAAIMAILWNIGLMSETSWSLQELLDDVDRMSRETFMVSRTSYFFTQLQVLCRYMGLVLLPLRQCVDPRPPFVHHFFEGWTPLAAAAVLAVILGAWFLRRRAPLASLGLLWFFSTLFLESSFIPIRDAMFEHRLYLSLLGVAWILAWTMQRTKLAQNKVAALCIGLLLAGYGVATHKRNQVWQNPIALWQEAVACNPKNFRAYNNLGRHLMDSGRLDEAYGPLTHALELDPFRPNVHYNLGLLYARTDRLQSALTRLSTALSLNPRVPTFYFQLGLVYHRMGLVHHAREAYQAALLHNPDMEGPAMNLAALAFQEGRFDEARQILEGLIDRPRRRFKPYYYLATVLRAQGHLHDALKTIDKALSIEPENTDGLFLRAMLLVDAGRSHEAIEILHLLKKQNPKDQRISFWLDKLSASGAQESR